MECEQKKCNNQATNKILYKGRKYYKYGYEIADVCKLHYDEFINKKNELENKKLELQIKKRKLFEESINNDYQKYFDDVYQSTIPCGIRKKEKHFTFEVIQYNEELLPNISLKKYYQDPKNYGFKQILRTNKLTNCDHKGWIWIKI